ncbi:helix-turn-helix transcriptional regulator [Streptomyces sp. NPDC048251]|uniref:helix-turn-helix transcriptional regulator n=1 Tax=Streptomyces sp. NPDC048251 TaxID=3154501 RepID=UPI003412DA42
MGRPEKPPAGPPHLRQLVFYLRDLRTAEGGTYEEMADRGNVSAATLKRVASGVVVPRWPRVRQYCLAASAGSIRIEILHEARGLWAKARMEQRRTLYLKKPRPEFIADLADLSHALYSLYEHAGAPPLREVQERAGGPAHLPLSTLARIVGRQTLPADGKQCLAFLRGCGMPEEQQPTWEWALQKVVTGWRIMEPEIDYAPPAWYTQNASPA